MKFGRIAIDRAEGAILAHSTPVKGGIIKKGRPLSADDVRRLKEGGVEAVIAATLEAGDIGEDEAAHLVARAAAGGNVRVAEPFTGRANLFADKAGVARLDVERLMALNRIDEGVTIATVPPFEKVAAGQMLATIKVITFAVSTETVRRATSLAKDGLVHVAPFKTKRAALILTKLANTKASVLDKRRRVIADRLAAIGSTLSHTAVAPHEVTAVREAIETAAAEGFDPVIVFAASAIVDRGDVIPAAVVEAGGAIVHLGMPVDPGNLLLTARLGDIDVIGAPSCAGSPKLNGFDWVLERRMAGLPVGAGEISAMGVGGLLKEIATRPQPREGGDSVEEEEGVRREPRIGCILLAAGRSTRMGPRNKLLEDVGGSKMVRRVAEAILASRARPIIAVTGHMADGVGAALSGLDLQRVHNPDYAQGLSTSLKAGLAALPTGLDGVIVALGDMPGIRPDHIDRMISAFAPKEGRSIIVPVHGGKRGNPVLWGAEFLAEMRQASGDTGAKHLIGANAEKVVELDLGTDAVLIDIDTPEALARLKGD